MYVFALQPTKRLEDARATRRELAELLTFENIEQWLPAYKNVTIEELPYCSMPIERALEVVRERKA